VPAGELFNYCELQTKMTARVVAPLSSPATFAAGEDAAKAANATTFCNRHSPLLSLHLGDTRLGPCREPAATIPEW